MKFWRRYWYMIGGVLFVFLAFFMGLWGSGHLPKIQTILVYSWMAMLVHQVEEYGIPGAFVAMILCFIAPCPFDEEPSLLQKIGLK